MLNFVYLRSSGLKVLHFWLDSCIVNKGKKFELVLGCWMHLEGFQVISRHFWALLHTGLTGRGHRSYRSECWSCAHVEHQSNRWWWPVWPLRAELMQLLCFLRVVGLHSSRLSCIGSGGACTCAGGALCGFRALVWWFPLFAWALFCLRCIEPLPLPKGSETCLLQVIFLFAYVWLSITCWSFFLFVSFHFLFSRVTICGCCQCTHQGGDWGPCVIRGPVDGRSWCDEWLTTLCGLILG
jgi:hypothetical protein